VSVLRGEGRACSEGCKASSDATTHGVLTTMFPFHGTERRSVQMLYPASVFPPSAEGDRGAAMPCEVLLPPASMTGRVSTKPSTVGPRLSHGARCGPTVPFGASDIYPFVATSPRTGDTSHCHGTGATRCARG
jgi:hypothetical protein